MATKPHIDLSTAPGVSPLVSHPESPPEGAQPSERYLFQPSCLHKSDAKVIRTGAMSGNILHVLTCDEDEGTLKDFS